MSIFISSLISLIDILASTINCSFETLTILLLLLPFSSILSPTIFSKHLDNVNNPEFADHPYVFPKDKTLKEKMPAWRSVLMHMLVERAYKTNGLVEDCSIVKAKSDEYRISQDYIAQFINEKINANDPDGKIQKRELSTAFAQWFQDTYSKSAPPAKELFSKFEKLFGELLRSAFLIRKDLTQGAKIISWASKVSRLDKESQKSFFRFSIELIRQSFLKNINATSLVNFEAKTDFNFDSFSKYVTKKNIEELCGQFENANYQTKRNGNSNMIMTGLALGLTKSIHNY